MTPSKSKQSTHEETAVSTPAETGTPPEGEAPMDPAQRQAMIAEAAFFMAQSRRFVPSQDVDDWLAAEREIDQRLPKPEH